MAFKPIPYEESGSGFQPIPYEESGSGFQPIPYEASFTPIPYEDPAPGFQPIPYEASFTPIPYEEPAPAVAAKPAAVSGAAPVFDPNIPPVASANSNQIAEVERRFAEMQENEKARTPVRDVLRDVAAIPGEIPKAFSRGVERLEGSVGPLISAVGDYVDTQQRQWNRVFAESPFGQFVGRRKQEKYIKKHGALPEPSIQAGKATAGERISTFGEGIYDWWNEAANTGWEAPDEKIYGGSFIENPSLTRVVGGAAESAPTMIGAMALSAAGHLGAGAALLAGSESAPIYIEAKRAGASESDAFFFALVSGLGTGVMEWGGLGAVMGKNPLVDEVIQKLGAKWYAGALVNFAVEGSQESLQEIYQNAVAMGWDGDRKLLDGALEAGLSGGLLGAGGSTARSVYSDFMQKQAERAKGMTDAQIDAAVRESMRPENAQIQLVRKDGQPTPAPVPGGDVAAPKGQTVQVDVSGQGPANPAMQQRLIELLNQAQPMPPAAAPAMLAAPQDQVPAALPLPDFAANREDNAPRSTTTGAAAPISELPAPRLVPVEGNPFAEVPVRPEAARVVDSVDGDKVVESPAGEQKAEAGTLKPVEQKKFLLAEIDAAIKAAPYDEMPIEMAKELKRLWNLKTVSHEGTPIAEIQANMAKNDKIDQQIKEIVGAVKIDVPGDGTFEIFNTQKALKAFKARAEKFPTSALKTDPALPSVKPSPMVALGKRPAKQVDFAKLLQPIAADKKDTRKALVAPYFNGDAREVVATDGRRIAVALDAPFKTTQIDPQYPDYGRAVPGYRAGEMPDRVYPGRIVANTESLYNQLTEVLHLKDKNPPTVLLFEGADGKLGVAAQVEEVGAFKSANVEGGRVFGAYSSEFLRDLVAFMRRMGNAEVDLEYAETDPLAAVDFQSNPLMIRGKREYGVLMGTRNLTMQSIDDRFGSQSVPRAESARPASSSSSSRAETAGAAKGGDASGGLGSAGVPVDDPLYSNLPIEMPELVEFAELLGQGKLPKIREKLGRAIGLFRFQRDNPDSGSIELRADIFNLVQPEDKQRLRGEALEYARKIKELDPNADETKVYRDRYDYLYDQLLAERKKQDPVLARKTLPHEIGHWVDLLPEWLISRGNILGHIAALKGYTKTLLSEKPGSPGPLTDKERAALRRKAEKELKALRGEVREIVEEIVREEPIYKEFPVTPDDVKGLMGLNAREATPELYEWFAKQERATKKQILKAAMQGLVDERAASFGRREQVGTRTTRETVRRTVGGEPITKEQIRQRYRELLKEEVARRRLHELETIKAELEEAIAWWNGTEEMPDYYRKPEEMFADAYSIFINNPQALAKRAPGFFKAMMDYMDARPHVRAIYDRLQEDIRSGAIYRNRVRRLHKAFEEGDASMFERQNAGRQKSATEWIDAVRYSVDAVFGPMEARVRRSGVSSDKAGEIGASIENYLYRATGHEYYMGRLHQEVVRPLLENDLQWSDLSELMFHNRVINERHSMANPLGWTPKSSQERLDEMQARLGPQRWAVLEQARSNLWALNGTVREMIREAGLFTPELLDRIDENLHYATFAVMRDGSTGNPGSIEEMLENAFGTNTGPKIFRQLGTLKKVQDPAAATAMKMLSLMDAARRNVAKTELVDLLRNEFPGEIKAADMRWNGIYREIVVRESERAGMIVVMRNGKPEGWYVPKVFVSAFERGNTVENQVLMKMLSAPSRAVKNLYTQLNYGFWPVAFVRDVMAFKVKMPRVSNVPFGGPQFWRHFGRALVDSWSSVMGAPNAGALESLSKQDWITVANPMASRGEGEAIDKLMQRYWQDPANLEADRPEVAAVMRAFTKWMELGQVFERTVKRAGRLYLDRNFKEMPEWRKQFIVHNYSGSPNFLRKGALNPVLDFAALFYNPWKESIRSTFRRFKESPATMAWNTAKYAVAPKVMMWLFASGAMTAILKELFGDDGEEFGRDVERMFRYVPEYDKANHTIIPLGWDDRENNKVAYLRLSLAEEMRIPAALTWKMLNKSGDYQQSINYMGGQLPVGNPILEVLSAWRQYLSGRNPYDWFRGQPLLDDNVAEARDWRGAAAMGKYTWNALGGSIIHRFNLQDYGDDKTKAERFLDLPVISNALGRWVKVSNRGLADTLRQEVSEPFRRDQARSRLDARSALQSGDMDRIEKLKIQDPRAEAYILNNSSDIFKRKAMKPEESMIIFAPTVEERTALETELMKYR